MEICAGGSAGVTNCCYAAKPLSPTGFFSGINNYGMTPLAFRMNRLFFLAKTASFLWGILVKPCSIPALPVCDRICFGTFAFENLSAALKTLVFTSASYRSLKVLFRITAFLPVQSKRIARTTRMVLIRIVA